MSETDKKLSIEESLEQIDEILNRMEAKETGLEESFRLYERGLKLIKDAEAGIDKIEKEIRILNEEE
ncbi:MAG: exodeoxyribonuclease VII small subunit [Eubacteriales bacterium]|nr:exodeoxyribonuclease VII small subunit [Eubacteriales bacterium]